MFNMRLACVGATEENKVEVHVSERSFSLKIERMHRMRGRAGLSGANQSAAVCVGNHKLFGNSLWRGYLSTLTGFFKRGKNWQKKLYISRERGRWVLSIKKKSSFAKPCHFCWAPFFHKNEGKKESKYYFPTIKS